MIYKRFGKWWVVLLNRSAAHQLPDTGTEFAAINLASRQFGISPLISVPLSMVALIAVVVTGSYLRWERVTIGLCLLDLAWLWLAGASHVDAKEALHTRFGRPCRQAA